MFFYFNRSRHISPMLKLLIAIKYYASGAFQINVGDMTSVSRQSANAIIPRVSKALASLRQGVIKMPTANEELEYNAYKTLQVNMLFSRSFLQVVLYEPFYIEFM